MLHAGNAIRALTLSHPTTQPLTLFWRAGIAIGNGLTEPRTQTLTLAGTALAWGLAPLANANGLARRAKRVVKASVARGHLKAF